MILKRAPFCSLQTAESKKTAFCCTACARYLGDLDAQLLRAKGQLQKANDFYSDVLRRSSMTCEKQNQIFMCPMRGCAHGYCSDECQLFDKVNNGHWLICTGGARDNTNLTREFLQHASKTNDLFTAGLSVVAKLISIAMSKYQSENDHIEYSNQKNNTTFISQESSVSTLLEEILGDFESQYHCSGLFWNAPVDSVLLDSKASEEEDVKKKKNHDKNKKRKRQNNDNCHVRSSDCNSDGESDFDDVAPLGMSNVLEQQTHESWTLLQLLLRHEKSYTSFPFNSSHHITTSTSTSTSSSSTSSSSFSSSSDSCNHNDNNDDNDGNQPEKLLLNIVLNMADALSFSRWSSLISSLYTNLVPLLIETPLIPVAKKLPNVPLWEDRKNILQAFDFFLPSSSNSLVEDKMKIRNGDEDDVMLDIERKIVRLAQAASILPTSTSTSTSSTSYSINSNKSNNTEKENDLNSVSVPTENPFNRFCYFAMALIPGIGTNIGCINDDDDNDNCDNDDDMKYRKTGEETKVKIKLISKIGNKYNDEIDMIEHKRKHKKGQKQKEKQIEIEINVKENALTEKINNISDDRKNKKNKKHFFVSHSCVPNFQINGIMSEIGLQATLVALRDVKKGELVQCSAIDHSNQVRTCTYVRSSKKLIMIMTC